MWWEESKKYPGKTHAYQRVGNKSNKILSEISEASEVWGKLRYTLQSRGEVVAPYIFFH